MYIVYVEYYGFYTPIKMLGCFKKLDDALNIANTYIKNNFINNKRLLVKNLKRNYVIDDSVSYGNTVYIKYFKN